MYDFLPLVGFLTNGFDDLIGYDVAEPNGISGRRLFESDFFRHPGLNGIDFNGFAIQSIGLQINQLDIEQMTDFTMITFSADVIRAGQPIPEPSTLLLLGMGVLGVMGRTWQKRYSHR
jgi:hypothetical protein